MSIGTLVLYIGIIAIILTAIIGLVFKKQKSWLMSFFQNFTGVLFIVSGFVKAVDPLGTAYKMEQYFAEFQGVFSETWLSFIAPVFPWFSEHSAVFSVLMIVFEIVLGIMLIIGAKPKLTAWAFFLLVILFTILTGFTYLTGYVPQGVHFFNFSGWGPFVETNMKVTDCGCFGDFIKLKPFTSFCKDLVLLVPSFYFIFRHKDMHQLFSARFRSALTWVSLAAITFFCLYNYQWTLPVVDFRPFYVGQDVRSQKEAEIEAAANVQITDYKLINKSDGSVVEIPYEQFMKEFKSYPKEEWDYEQIRSEPAIKATKLSDFEASNAATGEDVTEAILNDPNYSFMIVSYKLPSTIQKTTITVQDSLFLIDTVKVEGMDELMVVKSFDKLQSREVQKDDYLFDKEMVRRYNMIIKPIAEKAKEMGQNIYVISAYADPAKFEDFKSTTQCDIPFYTADDILLKTIIRSNPGIVLLKDGVIIDKWHWRQFQGYEIAMEGK